MIEKIVEIIDIGRKENQVFLWCDDVYKKERYWVYASKKLFEEVRIGDMFRIDVVPGIPWGYTDPKLRAIKAEFIANYPRKVKDVLDI